VSSWRLRKNEFVAFCASGVRMVGERRRSRRRRVYSKQKR